MRALASMYVVCVLLLTLPCLLTACGTGCCDEPDPGAGNPGNPVIPGDAMASFLLPDVNSTSPRYQELVSPRDYGGRISAWYFGQAT